MAKPALGAGRRNTIYRKSAIIAPVRNMKKPIICPTCKGKGKVHRVSY